MELYSYIKYYAFHNKKHLITTTKSNCALSMNLIITNATH